MISRKVNLHQLLGLDYSIKFSKLTFAFEKSLDLSVYSGDFLLGDQSTDPF